jgi:hypothetical protein
MPTRNGTPIDNGAASPAYVGPLHPFNWLDIGSQEALGVQQSAVMRGQPPAMAYWQRRWLPGPGTVPQGTPFWLTSRPYSRGAEAHAPHFGILTYNPIGAGIYAPYKLPPMAGPAARYVQGAIWFDVQSIPTGLRFNPTVPVETVDALIGQSHVAAAYRTTG